MPIMGLLRLAQAAGVGLRRLDCFAAQLIGLELSQLRVTPRKFGAWPLFTHLAVLVHCGELHFESVEGSQNNLKRTLLSHPQALVLLKYDNISHSHLKETLSHGSS